MTSRGHVGLALLLALDARLCAGAQEEEVRSLKKQNAALQGMVQSLMEQVAILQDAVNRRKSSLSPSPGPSGCRDRDGGATDAAGYSCVDGFQGMPQYCGLYDDSDFTSISMCCECFGVLAPWRSLSSPECLAMQLQTQSWGSEISWRILQGCSVHCTGTGYSDNRAYDIACCLEAGVSYTLECEDSFGDGWNGGSMTIGGEVFCDDGSSWSLKAVTLLGATPAPGCPGGCSSLSYWVDDGCHHDSAPPDDDVVGYFEKPNAFVAGARCCSSDGMTCTTPDDCPGSLTLEVAEQSCINQGLRLCTNSELLSEMCCGTGGNCDHYAVWTSTSQCVCDATDASGLSSAYPCTCGRSTCTTNHICDAREGTCTPEACDTIDGSGLSSVYPCTCGNSTCTTNRVCNANSSICIPAACETSDGSAPSGAYPCTCGNATCTTNDTCSADSNTCNPAACAIKDGSGLSSAFPCTCGNATCTTNHLCSADSSTCTPAVCAVADGSGLSINSHPRLPCTCGNATCTSNAFCNVNSSTCTPDARCGLLSTIKYKYYWSSWFVESLSFVRTDGLTSASLGEDTFTREIILDAADYVTSIEGAIGCSYVACWLRFTTSWGRVIQIATEGAGDIDGTTFGPLELENGYGFVGLAGGFDEPFTIMQESCPTTTATTETTLTATTMTTITTATATSTMSSLTSLSTTSKHCEMTHEAELEGSQSLSHAGVEAKYSNFTGPGYVQFYQLSGSSVEWLLPACIGGRYKASIRYSLGNAEEASLRISVNGSPHFSTLRFMPTNSWSYWASVHRLVILEEGDNSMSVTTTGQLGPFIDNLLLELQPENATDESAGTLVRQSEWWSVSGPCRLNGKCAQSPGWPMAYEADQACHVNPIFPTEQWFIDVSLFRVEAGSYDVLVVNGHAYSGQDNALHSGIVPTAEILWTSDDREQQKGWELCATTCDPGFAVVVGTDGLRSCESCLPGRFNGLQGVTDCGDCPAGRYAEDGASTACQACGWGKASGTTARSTPCNPCDLGRYADGESQTSCTHCRDPKLKDGLLWTTMRLDHVSKKFIQVQGAKSHLECGCKEGAWRTPSGTCQDCSTGMECPGMGRLLLEPGYWSSVEDPGSIYVCFDGPGHHQCPGGIPGSCGIGRVNSSVACSECQPGMVSKHHGVCAPCEASSWLKLATFCSVIVFGLAILYHLLANENRAAESTAKAMLVIVLSQGITAAQLVGILGSITVAWPPPVDAWFDWAKVLTFRFAAIDAGCVVPQDPIMEYSGKLLCMLVLLLVMVVIHHLHVLALHGGSFRRRASKLTGACGAIFTGTFISISSTIFYPLDCQQHPNELWTVEGAPKVVCWTGDFRSDHSTMLFVALMASSVLVGFIAFVCWVLHRLPARLYHADVDFLHKYAFLFYRFQPNAYWYVLVHLARNLVAALVPALADPASEILVLAVILVPSMVLTSALRPWRVWAANIVEVVVISCILFSLILAGIVLQDADRAKIGIICCGMMLGILLALGAGVIYAVCAKVKSRVHRSFSFFLCHGKAGGVGFARLLTWQLVHHPRVPGRIYLDEDNDFQDLGFSFDCVRDSAAVLVVCTPDVLRSPMSVGMLCMARQQEVPLTLLLLRGFTLPHTASLFNYKQTTPGLNELAPFGVSPDMIVCMLKGLPGCTCIRVPERISMACMSTIADKLCEGRPEDIDLNMQFQQDPGAAEDCDLVILVDHQNFEAVCTSFLLHSMLIARALGKCEPHVLQPDEAIPPVAAKLIVMCSRGCLEAKIVAQTLLLAARQGLLFLPVIVDEKFETPSLDELCGDGSNQVGRVGTSSENDLLADVVHTVFRETSAPFYPHESARLLGVRLDVILRFRDRALPKRNAEAAILAATPIAYHGRVLERKGTKCIASFPGKYAAAWDAVISEGHHMSVGCVFLTDEDNGLGLHAPQDPADPRGPCWCHALYGERSYKRLGYVTTLPAGLTLGERVAKTEQMAKFGIVVILPTDTVDEVRAKEEEAARNWAQNGRVASWGCQWFVEWKANIDAAIERDQRLQVYFFEGQVGEGVIPWEDLSDLDLDLWDATGLGGSQKGEVAWLIKQGYEFDMVDVRDFQKEFLSRPRGPCVCPGRRRRRAE